jgi:DNA polymerase III alpha subunit
MQAVNHNSSKTTKESSKSSLTLSHVFSEDELCNLYMIDPNRIISRISTSEVITISDELELDLSLCPNFVHTTGLTISKDDQDKIDEQNQSIWFLPDTYKDFDIAKYVIGLCETDSELQRVGEELIMFQERGLFPLLRYMKYLVDTMRANNIVWGVGRGSSVASYVLFLLEVHRINSMYYDLSITDFLKELK